MEYLPGDTPQQRLQDLMKEYKIAQAELTSKIGVTESSMLLMTGKEQPEIRKATQQAAQAVSLNKVPVFQADLTNIQNQFMAVLREIKKEMTSGERISQNMTKELTSRCSQN